MLIANMLIKSGEFAPSVQAVLDLDKRMLIKPDLPKEFFYLSDDFPTYNILRVNKNENTNDVTKYSDWYWYYREMLNKKFVYRAVLVKGSSQKWMFTPSAVYYQEWAYSRYKENCNGEMYGGMLFDKTVIIGLCRNTRVVEDLGGYTGLLYAYQKDGESIILTPNGLINLGHVDEVDITKLKYSSFARLPLNVYGMYMKDGEIKYVEI